MSSARNCSIFNGTKACCETDNCNSVVDANLPVTANTTVTSCKVGGSFNLTDSVKNGLVATECPASSNSFCGVKTILKKLALKII